MKKCPFCAEEIQDDAVKCRFCGEFLKKKKKWINCLLGCLIAFIASILLIILFSYFSFLLLKFIMYKVFFPAPRMPGHYQFPLFPPGLDLMFQNFGEFLRSFWERLMEFFGGRRVV